MKEQLITFETAKLAKEKGFNGKCNSYYYSLNGENRLTTISMLCAKDYNNPRIATKSYCSAPTQSLLQRWLREKHMIFIDINTMGINVFKLQVFKMGESVHFVNGDTTYEEALEAGLQEALKLIES